MDYINVAKERVASLCLHFGKILDPHLGNTDDGTGKPISGAQLLWALAGRESSFGKNCKPRYEPAYDYDGRYGHSHQQFDLLTEYGSDAAYSYGPWQIMLCNAIGYSPRELAHDPEKACVATIGFIRRHILEGQKAHTLEQISDSYNSGNYKDRVTDQVRQYIEAVRHFYFTEVIDGPNVVLHDDEAGTA